MVCDSPKKGPLEYLPGRDVLPPDAFPLWSAQANKEKLIQLWKQRWPPDSCELLLPTAPCLVRQLPQPGTRAFEPAHFVGQ